MKNGRGKSEYSDWDGALLSRYRSEMGMTKAELARKLGVSYRMYCYYESGHTKIDKPLEYAVRFLCENDNTPSEKPQGTLSGFDKDRITRLLHVIQNHPLDDLDDRSKKILQQVPKEIVLLLDKVV